MIYRPGLLPEPLATMRRWRTELTRAGLENPYIVMAQGFGDLDPRQFGIDAAVEFPPHKVGATPDVNDQLELLDPEFQGHVRDYAEVARYAASLGRPNYKLFRGVSPSWDNEARRPGRGLTFAHSTPQKYGAWLGAACRTALSEASCPDENIVFVNAWNEWAEGAYLEPDRHFGYAYLAETARVLSSLQSDTAPEARGRRPSIALLSHDAHLNGAQMNALAMARSLVADHDVRLTILLGGPGALTPQFAAVAPTETIAGNFASQSAWTEVAERLVASGVTAVISNTVVSAQAIIPLRRAGLRVVQLVHELPSLIRQYKLEQAARDAAEQATTMVFSAPYIRDRFAEIAGPIKGRVVICHQGLYMPRLDESQQRLQRAATRQALGIDENARVVLGVGYGEVRKGLDLWPLLVRRVSAVCPDVIFLWVGNVEPSLRHWLDHDLRMTGHERRMLMPGHSTDIAGMYAAADAFAMTSREDPFPSVVLEAMASGLPTVVFEDSAASWTLFAKRAGYASRISTSRKWGGSWGAFCKTRTAWRRCDHPCPDASTEISITATMWRNCSSSRRRRRSRSRSSCQTITTRVTFASEWTASGARP
jgi:glycosyltransferase involved in cell wall biosynthesis